MGPPYRGVLGVPEKNFFAPLLAACGAESLLAAESTATLPPPIVEYATITFEDLHIRLCDALRGEKPRVFAQYLDSGGGIRTFFEDGTITKDDASE